MTPLLSSATTYYVECGNYCRSNRIPVQAIINQIPSAPTAANVTRCNSGTVDLTAAASEAIYWYSSSSGGSLLGTGALFTTPVINNTTTFYVEDGNNCRSNRIAVQAIVVQQPAAPALTGGTRCGTGTVTLNATSSATVTWYNVSSGGTSLGSGLSYTTPSLSSTTTYYAQADNGCTSTRSSVQAIVNPIPSPPASSNVSRCGNGTVTLTATSTEQIYWYTVASGGSPVGTNSSYNTPSLSSTTTYYVETGNSCRSTRIPVQAIINSVPSVPVLTTGMSCGAGSVLLTATSSAQVNWFNVSSGGSSITTGLNFNTPSISTTTTYYAEASNGTCTSSRVSVQATINSIPANPVVNSNSRCGSGTVSLSATSTATVRWYDVSSGGTSLGTGLSFTTPSISSTTTYYAEANNNGCLSQRISVQAVVNQVPASPVASNVTQCGPGTVTLTATSPEQIYWYTVASGGTPRIYRIDIYNSNLVFHNDILCRGRKQLQKSPHFSAGNN